MKWFLVTIKSVKNAAHDPHNKKTGVCPVNPGKLCSDVTGEHHTLLWEGDSLLAAETHWRGMGLHVTRIEEVQFMPDEVSEIEQIAPGVYVLPEEARNEMCVERWPECFVGGYDPRCCRFPKSCSCWKD